MSARTVMMKLHNSEKMHSWRKDGILGVWLNRIMLQWQRSDSISYVVGGAVIKNPDLHTKLSFFVLRAASQITVVPGTRWMMGSNNWAKLHVVTRWSGWLRWSVVIVPAIIHARARTIISKVKTLIDARIRLRPVFVCDCF